jgi:NADH dehydrogenase FAD-containing subunit
MHADRVLLVGAGPVGIELAGEIVAKWPDKHVTLLDVADDVLGERFRPDLRAELRNQLVDLGVELVLGEGLRTRPPAVANELATFTVTTNSGREITADIWFQCFGVTPVSDYLSEDLAAARRPDGFVTVGPALQVAGHDNVFAIGDVSTADAKMAGIAGRQAQLVAQNIIKMVNGDKDLAVYEPFGPAIVVPIGPDGGSGQLPGQDELASREMVASVKGRDLMVDRYAEVFGVTTSVPK